MSNMKFPPFIEPSNIAFSDFPENCASAKGMRVIQADFSRPYCKIEKVQYAYKSGISLYLRMIIPSQCTVQARKLPLILYVPGSAWLKQDLDSKLVQLGQFSERGFVVAIVEYRPSTIAAFPAQVKDAKTAYRYLVAHAEKYRIDTDKIVIWGDSSGGHTASMVGLTFDEQALDDECPVEQPLSVKAVINYYGPTDISKMNQEPSTCEHRLPDSPEGLLIGGVNVVDNDALAQKANPINYIHQDSFTPPFLIFHGNKDRIVPFGQSVMLFDVLKNAGKKVDFYQLKGADHGQAPFWTPQVLDIVERFIIHCT
ncbi:alpha/beta hydrolase fold domain-containing protein [Vibrio astriarenae]